jgi:parvulin-like peptidyl-prolyl isomerase
MTTSRSSAREPKKIPMQRKEAARWQRERHRQRRVIVIAVIILIVILAIPSVGYYSTFVAPPRHTIITVNDVTYTMGDMVKQARATAALQVIRGQTPQLGTVPFEVLNGLVDKELLIQGAPGVGVLVTREDVDEEVRAAFYPKPPAGEVTDPESLEREYQENYRQFLEVSQLSDSDYREIARVRVLRRAVREKLSEQVPSVEESVYVHWIRIGKEETAIQLEQRLEAGEEFDALARELNQDSTYADFNGEVGWVPRGAFVEMEEVLFSIEHDTLSEALTARSGIHILKVTDGPELHEINETMRGVLEIRALEEWLDAERENNFVNVDFGSAEYEWVVGKIQELISISRALENSS